MSRSSKSELDPLSGVLGVLGACVSRRTRLEAAGTWSLAFPSIERLKFVAVVRGNLWVRIPGHRPQRLSEGDVCLLGRTAYTVCSDPDLPAIDGLACYAPGCDVARLGGDDTVGIGGSVTFPDANADFLLDMLPPFMVVPAAASASGTIAVILGLLDNESGRDQLGGEIVSARLADVLLVHAIRTYADHVGPDETGWLGALAHPRLGRALRALHADLARHWTVASLANEAGMSRAAFAAEFTRRVGQPPLAYLRSWRLTVARTALMRDETAIAHVADTVGYTSQSAFGNAFRRAYGMSPKAAARGRHSDSDSNSAGVAV